MEERQSRMEQKLESIRGELAKKVKQFDRPIVGWRPDVIERKEGETWEDDGKLWTVKNGIKQSITKLQEAKTPWWCPKCEKAMSHRFDDKFYRLYHMCYDCTIQEHTRMKLDGTWEAFEQSMVRRNEMAWLRDHIQECKDYIRTFKTPQVHFENGGWEELASIQQFAGLFEEIRADIKLCEQRLAVLEQEEQAQTEMSNVERTEDTTRG
jgi:hypothetical protein